MFSLVDCTSDCDSNGSGTEGLCVCVCVWGGGGRSWRVRVQRGQKFVQETDQIHFQIKIYIR
jgi:hypothetical protein